MEGEHTAGLMTNPELWVAVAFVLFVGIFGRVLWRNLAAILDKRGETVRLELDEANRLKMEATAMLADAQARRETALREAAELLKSAHDEAGRVTQQALADAAQAAQRRERVALDRIALAERQAVLAMRQLAARAAIEVATQIIEAGVPVEAGNALIDQAIGDLPDSLSVSRAA